MKILILLISVAAIVWIWRTLSSSRQKPLPPSQKKQQNMVECAHCGLHIPQDEAVTSEQRHYCCMEHSKLGSENTENH